MEGLTQQQLVMVATAIALSIKIINMISLVNVVFGSCGLFLLNMRKRKRDHGTSYDRQIIMQRKRAVGLRNKFFPHLNKLALIFDKDRATDLAAKIPVDVVQNIKVQNANAKDGLEDMNIEADMAENDGFTHVTRMRNKKRRSTESEVEDLVHATIDRMDSIHNICERASQQVGKLVDCFQFLADDAVRKLEVMDLISELKGDVEGMTEEDIVEITEIILSDPTKVDVFFSCSIEMRKIYIKKYLRQVR